MRGNFGANYSHEGIGVYFVSNEGEATGKKNSSYMQFFLLLHEEKNSIHPCAVEVLLIFG